jgi:hypothetical protein
MAKTRVKPLSDITIPRMELLGAVTATHMAKYIHTALNNTLTITKQVMWVDSQIVIHWVNNTDKKLPTYVQNRVNLIRKFPGEIRYVPSKQNPADRLTRGISAIDLRESD